MNSEIQVYHTRPPDFSPRVEVAAVYIKSGEQILFLKRAPQCHQPDKWGVPAGKLEKNEIPLHAAKRELFEETGIDVDVHLLKDHGKLFFRKPKLDYVYHMFSIELENLPTVLLSDEHTDYKWVTKDDMDIPLIDGALEALNLYYEKT